MHVLGYFDDRLSLKCHPCYHDKKPFLLNEIIIEAIFFFTYLNLLYIPLSLQTYFAENVLLLII